MSDNAYTVWPKVSDNNVIKSVVVSTFRVGVRLRKTPQGDWGCGNLDKKPEASPHSSKSSTHVPNTLKSSLKALLVPKGQSPRLTTTTFTRVLEPSGQCETISYYEGKPGSDTRKTQSVKPLNRAGQQQFISVSQSALKTCQTLLEKDQSVDLVKHKSVQPRKSNVSSSVTFTTTQQLCDKKSKNRLLTPDLHSEHETTSGDNFIKSRGTLTRPSPSASTTSGSSLLLSAKGLYHHDSKAVHGELKNRSSFNRYARVSPESFQSTTIHPSSVSSPPPRSPVTRPTSQHISSGSLSSSKDATSASASKNPHELHLVLDFLLRVSPEQGSFAVKGASQLIPLHPNTRSHERMMFENDINDESLEGAPSDSKRPRTSMDDDVVTTTKRVKVEVDTDPDPDDLVIDEPLDANDRSDPSSDNSNSVDEDTSEREHSQTAFNDVDVKTEEDISESSLPSSKFPHNSIILSQLVKNGHKDGGTGRQEIEKVGSRSPSPTSAIALSNNIDGSKTKLDNEITRIEKDVSSVASLLKSKEKEWNAILKLLKLKELHLEQLRRYKEIGKMDTNPEDSPDIQVLLERIGAETNKSGPDESQVRIKTAKILNEITELEQRSDSDNFHDSNSKATKLNVGMENFNASLALQQLSERSRALYGVNQVVNSVSTSNNKVIGEGRQGPIVEVRSIIADYRSKNPDDLAGTTTRRSISKKIPVTMPSNVSFKDVLVSLGKMANMDSNSSTNSTPPTKLRNSTASSGMPTISPKAPLATTLAKLLSSSGSSSGPPGINRSDDSSSSQSSKLPTNSITSNENSLSLATLLASSKCRDDDFKTEEEEGDVPLCQGCNIVRAQFVCAGCGSQWYCSRECQINAWEEHSDVCAS